MPSPDRDRKITILERRAINLNDDPTHEVIYYLTFLDQLFDSPTLDNFGMAINAAGQLLFGEIFFNHEDETGTFVPSPYDIYGDEVDDEPFILEPDEPIMVRKPK